VGSNGTRYPISGNTDMSGKKVGCSDLRSSARRVRASLLFCVRCLLVIGWLWVEFRGCLDTLRVSV
jgi:hypothetical protein